MDQVEFFKGCLSQILLDPFLNTLSRVPYQFWYVLPLALFSALSFTDNKNTAGIFMQKFNCCRQV